MTPHYFCRHRTLRQAGQPAGRKETDGRRKEWDGRCSNSFTDNDEAIDMAAGDTTPKLIRHTLYTHSTSLQDIFSLRYTYVLEVYSEAMYNLFQAFYRDC